jgi:hypothetical protein
MTHKNKNSIKILIEDVLRRLMRATKRKVLSVSFESTYKGGRTIVKKSFSRAILLIVP